MRAESLTTVTTKYLAGFTASVWTPEGRVQIEPAAGEGRYAVAYLTDIMRLDDALEPILCEFDPDPAEVAELDAKLYDFLARGGGTSHGTELRTYRLAVGATGEYTGQHGGTVPGALAAIMTTVNAMAMPCSGLAAIRLAMTAVMITVIGPVGSEIRVGVLPNRAANRPTSTAP